MIPRLAISFLLVFPALFCASGNPVYRYIEKNDLSRLEAYLMEHDINAVLEDSNTTLLVYAIRQESRQACAFLIEQGADVNQYIRGLSPLMHASFIPSPRIASQLVDAGAKISAMDSLGNTALFYAAFSGSKRICRLLLKNGAEINHQNVKWQNAYIYAMMGGQQETARFLRSYFERNLPDMRDGPYVKWGMFNRIKALYLVHDSQKNRTRKYTRHFKAEENPFLMEGFAGDSLNYLFFKSKEIPPDIFTGVEKILVMGDIHGGYDSLVNFLINNGIVNHELRWTWEDGHLVFLGDIFDRGDGVTETLWLIYRLEHQAQVAGGRVHFILGNHEILVLEGNLQYLSDKYQLMTDRVHVDYSGLFRKNTLLGQWLRNKNTVLKINDYLFVHAGLSPSISSSGITLHKLNELIRFFLNHPERDFINGWDREDILGIYGPFWYRGYIENNHQYQTLSEAELDKVLTTFNASKIFVGHTNVDHITPLFNSKVFTLDVPFYSYRHNMEALLIEGSEIYLLNSDGVRSRIQESLKQ